MSAAMLGAAVAIVFIGPCAFLIGWLVGREQVGGSPQAATGGAGRPTGSGPAH